MTCNSASSIVMHKYIVESLSKEKIHFSIMCSIVIHHKIEILERFLRTYASEFLLHSGGQKSRGIHYSYGDGHCILLEEYLCGQLVSGTTLFIHPGIRLKLTSAIQNYCKCNAADLYRISAKWKYLINLWITLLKLTQKLSGSSSHSWVKSFWKLRRCLQTRKKDRKKKKKRHTIFNGKLANPEVAKAQTPL